MANISQVVFQSTALRSVSGAAFGGGQGGTVHQPHQVTGGAAELEAPWAILGSADAMSCMSICPSLCHQHLPNRLPPEQGLQEVKAGSSFYLPVFTERTIADPIPQQGTQHIACRLQDPSRSRALDKTGGLSWQNSHPADLARFGVVAHQEICALAASCNSCMLLLSLVALPLCLFGAWKV